MVANIPNFDIIEGGFFQSGVDWEHQTDPISFHLFIENGLQRVLGGKADVELRFAGSRGETEYLFSPINGYRTSVRELSPSGYEMLIESPPVADVVVSVVRHPRDFSVLFCPTFKKR